MESIIVEIVLGGIDGAVEFMLPAHVPLQSITQDMTQLIEQINAAVAFDKENIALYDPERQVILRREWTLAQNGVRDGSRLMIL